MPKKQFGLRWAFETFEEDPSFYSKGMFGGLAAYVHDKMVMLLMETPGEQEYRGEKYPFDIWNGILLPTEREYHESLQNEFNNLCQHPVLGKWLYLKMEDPDFEPTINTISSLICKNDPRFGVYPKLKKTKIKKKAKKTNKKKIKVKIFK